MEEGSERARLAALARFEILDTPAEAEFDDLADLAAMTFQAPVALISLVDADREWIKARIGTDLAELPGEQSLGGHVIADDRVLVVGDLAGDDRFRESPLVAGAAKARFYAGAPLTTPDGHRVGALAILDTRPRDDFGAADQKKLQTLAASIVQMLGQRAAARKSQRFAAAAAENAEMLALAEQAAQVGTWVYDIATRRLAWSRQTYEIFGYDPEGPTPSREAYLALYQPDDAAELAARMRLAVDRAESYQHRAEIRRPDGTRRHVTGRGFVRRNEDSVVTALYGTVTDISEITLADAALRESEKRLRTQNWALTAYVRSTAALLHSEGLDSVVESVCQAIVEDDAYAAAAVALAEPLPGKALDIVAGAGRATGYVTGLKLSWSEEIPEGRGPTGIAVRSGKPHIMRDSQIDPTFAPWRERARRYGIRSSVTVPFRKGDTVLGVLLVYADRPDAFGPEEMTVFEKLAQELAFSISLEEDRARLEGARQARALAEKAEAEARRELVESEARYRLLAEQVPDIILRYDLEGVIEFASPSIRLLGLAPLEVVGRNIDILVQRPGFQSPTLVAVKRDMTLPSGRGNEWRFKRPDGQVIWLQGNPARIDDPSGAPIGIVTAIRDVTERRAMEDELRRKQEEAEAAAVVKAQFLANMSHEIRTPLTGVIGFANLLADMAELPDQARTYIDRIRSGGQALLAIVNDVLDFSRLEAGRVELDNRPHDPVALLDEAVALVRNDARAKGLGLRVDIVGDLPKAVTLDGDRLRQVLLNLLGNAIKFTPAGGVTVTVAYDRGDGRLRVDVADTGVGISPADAERLFQRFSQVDGSNTREFGGTGLGLAISRGLVEAMGGEIGVTSAEGAGSTFWFTVAAPAAAIDVSPTRDAPGEPHDVQVLPPLKILVVDDVAVNRELLATLLGAFDVETTEASNGIEAVEAAGTEAFDLILMDLQMPRMDGLEATRAIRARPGPNRTTPILAVSANVMPPQVAACRQAGMDDHIGKPIDASELLGKIAAWTDPETARATH